MFEQDLPLRALSAGSSLARVDEPRLRRIVETHFDGLWRFLRRLGIDEGDVDDAVQEVILVLARKLDRVVQGSERSFTFSTAFRIASDMRKRKKRWRALEESAFADGPSASLDPEASAEQRRLALSFAQVLEELPLELRAVFVLYELEDFTMAEIAATLGIPAGTVASRLRRGREAFEERAAQVLAHRSEP